ncbi:MAG TPA: glycoside hydrolase family 97 catalytic domain-containing protein, partial [Chitinophagaceae bacterium]|nr:glycoside hydrolase family 97 catalytic domain-containing protein [Chitinophagaceae bacterium]
PSTAQRSYDLYSPDSSLRLEIKTKHNLSWNLYAGNELLTQSASVDLDLANQKKLSDKLLVASHKYSTTNERIAVPVPYRKKMIINNYNQLELFLKESFSIQFRMYNGGMAYRLGLRFKDSIIIENENVSFELNENAEVWFAHMDKRQNADRFHTSFEAVYKKQSLAAIADTMLTYSPVTVSLTNGHHLAFSDANLFDYPGLFLEKNGNVLKGRFAPYPAKEKLIEGEFPQWVVEERAGYIAKIKGTRKLPWRAVLVAKKDTDLPNNDLIWLLGDKSMIPDPSWIKYGKGTDEWIIGINLFNVPFKAGINTATYKYYIDFAKRFGFDQVMLDAGWSDVKDLFRINPDIDMNELVDYAKKNNIRLMLWTLCATLDKQLDSALKQFSDWGIASIMTDFMDRDDQKMVNFYHRIAKACADHKISVMFHGAFPPKGFNRTWPNAITQEGVLGAEWNIWSELCTPEHNVAIAYTRMLAGPLDYEPGLLLNAQKDQFRPIGKNPMSIGTRCHQLAMFVVYDSPLQIFSGNPSQGLKEPEFMKLLGSIPTTWDETKILDGKIGEYIVTARRKGTNWFIAALNNSLPRDITVKFDFLTGGNFKTTICKDGLNAHNYGSDYELTEKNFTKNDSAKIHLAPGGGFLLKMETN